MAKTKDSDKIRLAKVAHCMDHWVRKENQAYIEENDSLRAELKAMKMENKRLQRQVALKARLNDMLESQVIHFRRRAREQNLHATILREYVTSTTAGREWYEHGIRRNLLRDFDLVANESTSEEEPDEEIFTEEEFEQVWNQF